LTREEAAADSSFNGLRLLGLNAAQIDELNCAICGTQTIEGSPGLEEAHYAVFDCANRCGKTGTRFITASGHIRMMAASQPFVTGAISKTINLPSEATIEEIADAYRLSWKLGLKANALYRDGCKLSQPLNSTTDAVLDDDEDDVELAAARDEVAGEVVLAAGMVNDQGVPMQVVEKVVERIIERPMRKRLPDTRDSKTHHFNVAGHEGYLTVGMYQDGSPGELFITMSKEGSTIGGLMDSLGTAISVALQYGVPITSLVNKFAHQRFEPQGITTNKDIPFAKSLVDYIFRWMGMEFVDGYKEDNAPARPAAPVAVKEDTRWTGDGTATASDGVRPPSSITSDRGIDTTVKTDGQTETVEEHVVVQATRVTDGDMSVEAIAVRTSLSQSTATLQSDAPPCPDCGQITVRNGTCYRCHNCGASLGCS
jgi:ribonucleoside-diphosphate reductase alpha chain